MKKSRALIIAVNVLAAVTSCSSDPVEMKTAAVKDTKTEEPVVAEEWFPETNFDTLRGLYTGDFGDGFINVVLTYVNDKKAIGYNVHKGLQRNINGSVVQKKDQFELTLNEPGDNKFDGIFTLIISKKDGSVNANWTANDPKIPSKKFKLKKQEDTKEILEKYEYDGQKITQNNFMDIFNNSNLDGGYIEFKENGILRYTYYPEEQENEQQEIIKGSWKFIDEKTMVVDWAKNTRFKLRTMKFKLVQSEDEGPSFQGPNGLSIYPDYY